MKRFDRYLCLRVYNITGWIGQTSECRLPSENGFRNVKSTRKNRPTGLFSSSLFVRHKNNKIRIRSVAFFFLYPLDSRPSRGHIKESRKSVVNKSSNKKKRARKDKKNLTVIMSLRRRVGWNPVAQFGGQDMTAMTKHGPPPPPPHTQRAQSKQKAQLSQSRASPLRSSEWHEMQQSNQTANRQACGALIAHFLPVIKTIPSARV